MKDGRKILYTLMEINSDGIYRGQDYGLQISTSSDCC